MYLGKREIKNDRKGDLSRWIIIISILFMIAGAIAGRTLIRDDYIKIEGQIVTNTTTGHSIDIYQYDNDYALTIYQRGTGINTRALHIEDVAGNTARLVNIDHYGTGHALSIGENNDNGRGLYIHAIGDSIPIELVSDSGNTEPIIEITSNSTGDILTVNDNSLINSKYVFKLNYTLNGNKLQENLVGFYGFDEFKLNAKTTAYDSSIYVADSTLYNGSSVCAGNSTYNTSCPQWVSGKSFSALKFDGVDDYASTPDNSNFESTDTFTVSFWVKPADARTNKGLVVKRDGSAESWFVALSATPKFRFEVKNTTDNAVYVESGTTPSADTWYYITSVYNSTHILIYTNGELDSTPNAQTGNIKDTTAPMWIGKYYSASESFNGTIDEVRIYNRVLDSEEIRALYYGLGAPATGHLALK